MENHTTVYIAFKEILNKKEAFLFLSEAEALEKVQEGTDNFYHCTKEAELERYQENNKGFNTFQEYWDEHYFGLEQVLQDQDGDIIIANWNTDGELCFWQIGSMCNWIETYQFNNALIYWLIQLTGSLESYNLYDLITLLKRMYPASDLNATLTIAITKGTELNHLIQYLQP